MFTQEQKAKLKAMGSVGLTTKLAQHDGYFVDNNESAEKQLVGIFGQKYFQKKASLKIIAKGLGALKGLAPKATIDKVASAMPQLDNIDENYTTASYYNRRMNPANIVKVAISPEILGKLLTKEANVFTTEEGNLNTGSKLALGVGALVGGNKLLKHIKNVPNKNVGESVSKWMNKAKNKMSGKVDINPEDLMASIKKEYEARAKAGSKDGAPSLFDGMRTKYTGKDK